MSFRDLLRALKNFGGGSGIAESQFFIIPSIFFRVMQYSPLKFLFAIHFFSLEVGRVDIRYSLKETVNFFIPNVGALNLPSSFSFLSRYSFFIIPLPPPKELYLNVCNVVKVKS